MASFAVPKARVNALAVRGSITPAAFLVTLLILPAYGALAAPGAIGLAVALGSLVSAAMVMAVEASLGRPQALIAGLTLLLVGQDTLIGLALHLSPSVPRSTTLLLIEAKTVVALLCLGALWAGPVREPFDEALIRYRWFVTAALCLVVFAVLSAGHGGGAVLSAAAYLRNFSCPLLYTALGWSIFRRARLAAGEIWPTVAATVVNVGLASALVQLYFGAKWDAWLSFDRLAEVKGPFSSDAGLPGLPVIHRVPGVIGEGVNASYVYGGLAVYLWLAGRRGAAVVGGAAAALAFGKGGLGVFVVAFALSVVGRRLWKRGASARRVMLPTLLGISALVAGFVQTALHITTAAGVFGSHSSAEVHVRGLIDGLRAAMHSPLGHGLGVGGNFANIAGGFSQSASAWIGTGSESAVGVVAYQLGIPGLVCLAAAGTFLTTALFHVALNAPDSLARSTARGVCGVVAGVVVLTLFQENALSAQATGLIFLLAGSLLADHARNVEVHAQMRRDGPRVASQ